MLRARIIPCLLVHKKWLVKTVGFKDAKYVGDPINAVKIFNEKEADELIVLDISATKLSLGPNFNLIEKLAAECRMPLCYGGGVNSIEQVIKLVDMGVEKVAISSSAIAQPTLINEMIAAVGGQSVVIVIDFYKKKNSFSINYQLCSHNGKKFYKEDFKSVVLDKLEDKQETVRKIVRWPEQISEINPGDEVKLLDTMVQNGNTNNNI